MAKLTQFVVAITLIAPQIAMATDGDPATGGKLFVQCGACHTSRASDPNGFGPNLNGVVGAKAGSRAGYVYSPAMVRSGIIWTPAALDNFLAKPNKLVPGTKMAFPGVGAPQARADIIAYLASLKGGRR